MRFDANIAASGTISAPLGDFQALTVSGQPVATGTGGGGSANTLQDAYDNGDGVITTTAGKPLAIVGEEYDGNVDFQVTGSGKFTESLQVGSGTVWIDGDKIQTPTLFVDGQEISTAAIETTASGVLARQLDLTHDPVGFWRLDVDLSDSSGNGADVDQNDSYVRGFMGNGLVGARDNGQFGYQSATGHSHLLLQGDITIEALVDIQTLPSTFNQTILAYGVNGGGSEADNWQYGLNILTNGQLRYRYEHGVNNAVDHDSGAGNVLEEKKQYHVAMVRSSNEVQFYVDGRKFGAESSGLGAPTGGTNSLVYINAFDSGNRNVAMSSVKIIDSALSEQEIWEEYKRTWPVLTADAADIDQVTAISGTFAQSLQYKGEEVAVLSDLVPTSPAAGTTVVSGMITRPLDLSYNPVALWTFQNNDLVDEVSGITLTVNGAGTAQFSRIGGNNVFAAHLDGATMFSSSDASLLNTGDLTFEALVVNAEDGPTGGTNAVICGWLGPTGDGDSANNFISRWTLTATNQQQYFAEEGTGSPNISYTGGYKSRVPGDSRTLTHVAMVRENNDIQFYVNGRPAGDPSSGLNAPNDGSSGAFYISGNNEDGDHFTGHIGSVKVLDKALSAAQILNEYERTLSFVEFPEEVVAASGTFGQSLTVSGVPVSLADGSSDFFGALIKKDTGDGDQNITNGSTEFITLPSVTFDTGGWTDPVNPTRLTVPSGLGITHIQVQGQASIISTAADSLFFDIRKNGVGDISANPLVRPGLDTSANNTTLQVLKIAEPVVDGDFFEMRIRNNTGAALDVADAFGNTWFTIHALQAGGSPQDLVAASGTFSDTLTISGVPVATGTGGEFAVGFRGAQVSTTSGTSAPTATSVDFGQEKIIRDTDGFWNPDIARFVIPAGVNKVRVQGSVAWESNTSGARIISVKHTSPTQANLTVSNNRQQAITTGGLDTFQETMTSILDVFEGDQIWLQLYQNSGSTLVTEAQGDFLGMSLEVIDPAPVPGLVGKNQFRGARVSLSSAQAITTATNTQVLYDTTDFDTDGFVVGGDESKFIIPEGVTKVRVRTQQFWENIDSNDIRQVSVRHNGFPGGNLGGSDLRTEAAGTAMSVTTRLADVQPGDDISTLVSHQRGSDLDLLGSSPVNWMEIEVVEDYRSFNIDELTTASGTFTESLTVSGVPVPLEGGGGSSFSYAGSYINAAAKPLTVHPKSDWFDDNTGQGPTITGTHDIDTGKWTLWDVDGVAHANNGKTGGMYDGSEPRVTYDTNQMHIIHDGSTTGGWLGYFQAAPADDFTITARISNRRGIFDGSAGGEENTVGIFIAEDLSSSPGTKQLVSMGLHWDDQAPTSNGWARFQAAEWSDYNSLGSVAELSGEVREHLWVRLWYRTSDDRVIHSYSIDGITWSEIKRETPIGFTVGSIGFGIQSAKTFTSTGKIDFFAVASGVTSDQCAGHGRLVPIPTFPS